MEFLIVTGFSGAGKSRAADILEDLDFYCVDNMPAALLTKFAEFCQSMGGRYRRVALVVDIRDRAGLKNILGDLKQLSAGMDCTCRILFIEADLATIVKRYKESRRPHPLQAEAGSMENAILLEKRLLQPLRDHADFIIDTSSLTLGMLQGKLFNMFMGDRRHLNVTVMSFGFKHGLPLDADMVFDVRFMPNPFYVSELRELTGLDAPVSEFIFRHETAARFMKMLEDMMALLLPLYIEEGKHSLTVAVGCTGGRHRSVAVAARLTDYINALGEHAENVNRDMNK